jgi:hexosaminidase
MPTPHLIPSPKHLHTQPGRFALPDDLYLVLQPHPATRNLFAVERFALDAYALTGCRFHLVAGEGTTPEHEIRLTHDPDLAPDLPPDIRTQAYRLTIAPTGILIHSCAAPGTFYALQTLLQIIRESAFARMQQAPSRSRRQAGKIQHSAFSIQHSLPCLTILDFPDFPRRGFYHDTARGKVPTIDTLLQLIDDLSHLKYNEFQLYVENNFQFRKHPALYDDTTPFTAEELLVLDAACRARHIDFVPSLTSLGHFEKILSRPAYRHLAEAEPAQLKAIGAPCWHEAGPWSLCVTDPAARQLLADMYAEFAPNFTSGHFNICCDEAYDLGRVRSKTLADKIGTGQMYVDWIRYCDTLARSHGGGGKSIQMWGDIILNHPDLISQLPENATLLEWGYEHDHKFDEHCQIFAQRLKPQNSELRTRHFYVSPGTSSWLTLSARTRNSCGNIHNAATAGLKYGAKGLLLTDWGDQGHQQFLSISLTPLAYAAAASWNLAATPNPNTPKNSSFIIHHSSFLQSISLHLFQDPSAQFAALAYDLGLTYERLGWQRFNASLDHLLFREKWDFANYVNRAPAHAIEVTIRTADALLNLFKSATLMRPDGTQIRAEFLLTCREITHTCRRTLLRQLWLAADPARRNPEEPTRRDLPPKPLSRSFPQQMRVLRADAISLKKEFSRLWRARNKKSRLNDILAEFNRLAVEYTRFA